jgi:ferredoxin, 2Fe-2S
MPIIRILPHAEYCPQGAEISAPAGTSICEAMLENHINIEHACDMSCACTTCHVIVREGLASLNEQDENEEDLLDRAWGLEPKPKKITRCARFFLILKPRVCRQPQVTG